MVLPAFPPVPVHRAVAILALISLQLVLWFRVRFVLLMLVVLPLVILACMRSATLGTARGQTRCTLTIAEAEVVCIPAFQDENGVPERLAGRCFEIPFLRGLEG